jgi:hypothetical protein
MSFTSRLSQIASRRFSTKKFNDVVIVAATRTPIGSFQSAFNGLSATQLGGIAVEAAVQQAGIAKENVDEVILGNVVSAGLGKGRRSSRSLIIKNSGKYSNDLCEQRYANGTRLKRVQILTRSSINSNLLFPPQDKPPLVKQRSSLVSPQMSAARQSTKSAPRE